MAKKISKKAAKAPKPKPSKVSNQSISLPPLPPSPLQASYKGAIGGRLSTPWSYSSLDPRFRYGSSFDRVEMLNRARDLQQNNPIAAGMLQRMTENVVGDGYKLQVTSADPDWNKKAQALMEGWMPYAEASGLTLLEVQRLIYMSSRRDGDIGCILISDGTLQLVEADLIGNPLSPKYAAMGWRDGVQYNSNGRPVAYSVAILGEDGKPTFETIDAEDMILFAKRERPTTRGMSAFATTFNLFDQLDAWIEALIVAARIAACYSLVVTKDGATTALTALQANATAIATAANGGTAPTTIPQPALKLAPGMVTYLEKGDTVSQLTPSQPQQAFPASLQSLLRIIGAPWGMPLELITLDFSSASGPTARAAMLQAYRTFKTEQKLFTDSVMSRIYRWRISKFIKDGLLPYRADAFNHRWIAPQWPMLDPNKELAAQKLAIDMGIETQTSLLQQMGHSFESWLEVRKAELDAQRLADIPLVHLASTQLNVAVRVTDDASNANQVEDVEDGDDNPADPQDKSKNVVDDDGEGDSDNE